MSATQTPTTGLQFLQTHETPVRTVFSRIKKQRSNRVRFQSKHLRFGRAIGTGKHHTELFS